MKTSISLICTVTLLLFAVPLFAQSGNNGNINSVVTINVSAQVQPSSVEIITIQSMNLSGAEAVNDVITINPQTSTNAGKLIATGRANSDIRISFLESRELVRSQGSGTLTFNYTIAGNSLDDQSTAEILDRENRELNFNENGEFYLWVGGNVDVSTAEPGNYQGEFTVEIEYI